jgi:NAD(P)-dependent dehydrogenase (short-subunit alcohol dehydrogenase family)
MRLRPNGARSRLAKGIDTVADAMVAPGFSRIGIALRRSLEGWGEPPRMDGKVALVTGATSGIGLAAATSMAALGAEVHLVGRSAERGELALAVVERAGRAPARLHLADLSEPLAVAALGAHLVETCDKLDALVHNAGALTRTYEVTSGGTERTVATQVLGPYILTAALVPLMLKGLPATIVTVSSGGMYTQRFDLSGLELSPENYDGTVAYARAKRAQVVLAGAWAQRFAPAGLASYAMHPGWVDTPGLEMGLPRFRLLLKPLLRSPAEGADTIVWLAAGGPAVEARASGNPAPLSGLFHDRHLRSDHRHPVNEPIRRGDGEALLEWCARLTGIDTPSPDQSR